MAELPEKETNTRAFGVERSTRDERQLPGDFRPLRPHAIVINSLQVGVASRFRAEARSRVFCRRKEKKPHRQSDPKRSVRIRRRRSRLRHESHVVRSLFEVKAEHRPLNNNDGVFQLEIPQSLPGLYSRTTQGLGQ